MSRTRNCKSFESLFLLMFSLLIHESFSILDDDALVVLVDTLASEVVKLGVGCFYSLFIKFASSRSRSAGRVLSHTHSRCATGNVPPVLHAPVSHLISANGSRSDDSVSHILFSLNAAKVRESEGNTK